MTAYSDAACGTVAGAIHVASGEGEGCFDVPAGFPLSAKTAEVIARLEEADIANARLNDMAQFWAHPQLAARGRWAKVGSSAGELDMLKPPLNLSDFEPRMDAIPGLGEHSRAVLRELGYSDAEIERLAQVQAI